MRTRYQFRVKKIKILGLFDLIFYLQIMTLPGGWCSIVSDSYVNKLITYSINLGNENENSDYGKLKQSPYSQIITMKMAHSSRRSASELLQLS